MKRTLLTLLAALVLLPALADEGMWLPSLISERINDMLERKRELADLTVATGEGWVGDLSTDELKALFRLESPENA